MVRKMIVIMLCLCAIGTSTAFAAEENTIEYPVSVLSMDEQLDLYALQEEAYQGTISTTYVTFFRDIASTLPISHDYVMLRTGDNTYKMYSGDFIFDDDFYMQGNGYVYTINYVSGSGFGNTYYSYSVSPVSDVSISANNKLIYSNLGNYPSLTDRGASIEFALFVAIFTMCLCFALRSVFSFVLRFTNGYSH